MAFLRSVTTIGLFTLLSRVFGFVRDLMIASFLGAGPVADAFVVAQRLPNAFRSIFAEGAMDTAFVPIYTRKRQRELPESVQDFTNHIFTILVIILLPLVGIALMIMPHIVALIAPGFVNDLERFPLALAYSNITFSYLILISLTALQGGLLNANGRFGPYAAAPAILNLVMIIGFVIAAFFNLDPALVGSWALIAGGVIQLTVLFFSCRAAGLSMHFALPKLTVDVKQFFKLVGPGIVGMTADQLNLLILTTFASVLPSGAISALYYAERLNQLPLGVIGNAVATALLPSLTKHIAGKDTAKTTYFFSRALEITLMLCMPASLVLLVMPLPLVQLLFKHGVFDETSARLTAATITGYALTIPGGVLMRIFTVRFFAHENTRMPVICSLFSILCNIGLAYYLRSIWQVFGIALAYTMVIWINAIILWIALNYHGYAKLEKSTWKKLARIAFASTVMVVFLIVMKEPAEVAANLVAEEGAWHLLAVIVIRAGVGCLAYLAVLLMSGALRIADIKKLRNS